jgi:hypothetical protein
LICKNGIKKAKFISQVILCEGFLFLFSDVANFMDFP